MIAAIEAAPAASGEGLEYLSVQCAIDADAVLSMPEMQAIRTALQHLATHHPHCELWNDACLIEHFHVPKSVADWATSGEVLAADPESEQP